MAKRHFSSSSKIDSPLKGFRYPEACFGVVHFGGVFNSSILALLLLAAAPRAEDVGSRPRLSGDDAMGAVHEWNSLFVAAWRPQSGARVQPVKTLARHDQVRSLGFPGLPPQLFGIAADHIFDRAGHRQLSREHLTGFARQIA